MKTGKHFTGTDPVVFCPPDRLDINFKRLVIQCPLQSFSDPDSAQGQFFCFFTRADNDFAVLEAFLVIAHGENRFGGIYIFRYPDGINGRTQGNSAGSFQMEVRKGFTQTFHPQLQQLVIQRFTHDDHDTRLIVIGCFPDGSDFRDMCRKFPQKSVKIIIRNDIAHFCNIGNPDNNQTERTLCAHRNPHVFNQTVTIEKTGFHIIIRRIIFKRIQEHKDPQRLGKILTDDLREEHLDQNTCRNEGIHQ